MEVYIRQATPEDAHGIARVHVDSWRTSYAGVVPAEILSGLSYSERQFYESLGGELVARKDMRIGGVEVVEVAYGWQDIAGLFS